MFRWTCYAGAAVFAYVGAVLLFMPAMQIDTLGLALDAGGEVMGRRSTPLYFVVAGMALWFANQPPSPARRMFTLLWGGSLVLIAGIGTVDLAMGRVSQDILLAIAVELALAAGLFAGHIRG